MHAGRTLDKDMCIEPTPANFDHLRQMARPYQHNIQVSMGSRKQGASATLPRE